MKSTLTSKIIFGSFLASMMIFLTHCSSGPTAEWEKKNNELIKQYDLDKRELSGLPDNKIASNLEEGKVTSTDTLKVTALYPGVSAKIFWGTGTMAAILQLEPNAQIPEQSITC